MEVFHWLMLFAAVVSFFISFIAFCTSLDVDAKNLYHVEYVQNKHFVMGLIFSLIFSVT